MNTGILDSITNRATMKKTIAGTDDKYAKLHNYGGAIRAKTAGVLTIPISSKSYGKSARRFRSAFLVRTPGATFIAREVVRGKKKQLESILQCKKDIYELQKNSIEKLGVNLKKILIFYKKKCILQVRRKIFLPLTIEVGDRTY